MASVLIFYSLANEEEQIGSLVVWGTGVKTHTLGLLA